MQTHSDTLNKRTKKDSEVCLIPNYVLSEIKTDGNTNTKFFIAILLLKILTGDSPA